MLRRAAGSVRCYSTDKHKSAVTIVKPENSLFPAHIISGVPEEVTSRNVRIFQPCKTATQSGLAATRVWKLDFDNADKWTNPIMGWTSSADPVQSMNMQFVSRDAAVEFAQRQGYHYWVDEPKPQKFRKKIYAENFTYSPDKLRMLRTK